MLWNLSLAKMGQRLEPQPANQKQEFPDIKTDPDRKNDPDRSIGGLSEVLLSAVLKIAFNLSSAVAFEVFKVKLVTF